MDYPKLAGFQRECLFHQQPFVSYRLPDASEPVTILSFERPLILRLNSWLPEDEKGFIFAPFDVNMPSIWYRADHLFFGEDASALQPSDTTLHSIDMTISAGNDQHYSPEPLPASTSKDNYLNQVEKVLKAIKAGTLQKAVLSRNLRIPFERNTHAPLLFNSLMDRFPHAFVYLVSFPGIGCWLGASPELLLNAVAVPGNISFQSSLLQLETMALAGTRKVKTPGPWGQKEINEQEWVVKYIEERLDNAGCTDLEKSETYTCSAGNVEHLRTDFKAILPSIKLDLLLQELHPTPAVCGWPAPEALELIRATEDYPRSFYSGYLGPVNLDRRTSLFVNLRCMQIAETEATLYAGGGITLNSEPEAEWEETAIKSRTLLAEIEKIQNLAF